MTAVCVGLCECLSILLVALPCMWPTNNPAISLAPFLPLQSPCLGLQYLQSCSRFFISFPVLIWLMNSFFKLIPSAFYLGRILWSFTWLMEFCFQLYYWFNRTLILNLLGFIMGGGSGRAHSRASFSCFCSIVFKIHSGSIACVRLPNLALCYSLWATLQMEHLPSLKNFHFISYGRFISNLPSPSCFLFCVSQIQTFS